MRAKYLRTLLSLEKTDVVLDAGCGMGYFTSYLGTHVKQAIGIDIEPWRIKEAKKIKEQMTIQNVDFNITNIYNILYHEDYFNKIVCVEVSEHLRYPEKALHEFARVCIISIVIQIPTVNIFKIIGEKIFGQLKTKESVKEDAYTSFPYVQKYDNKTFFPMIQSCGFKMTNVVRVRLIPLNLITESRIPIYFEYLCDSTLGTHFPLNMFGTMTVIKAIKR